MIVEVWAGNHFFTPYCERVRSDRH